MANIVLKNTEKSITTANGSYHFDGVPMGNYEITGTYTGFKSQLTRHHNYLRL
jgi:outer membrane receptor for ferrienterochelin and colicins